MIGEVDAALAGWLGQMLAGRATVVFDQPDGMPAAPVLHVLLHEVREDPDGAPAGGMSVRDDAGRVVARLAPPRRYRLHYLLTAWAGGARAEHELLGTVLTAAATAQALPPDCLTGELAAGGYPVLVRCAPQERTVPAAFGWLDGRPPARTGLELAVLATMTPEPDQWLAPPPRRLDVRSGVTEPSAHRLPRPAITEPRRD